MVYLKLASNLESADVIFVGPIFTPVREKAIRQRARKVVQEFNESHGLYEGSDVVLRIDVVLEPVGIPIGCENLEGVATTLTNMVRRQYRERYEEPQNV